MANLLPMSGWRRTLVMLRDTVAAVIVGGVVLLVLAAVTDLL
jgi:hypothetical protein